MRAVIALAVGSLTLGGCVWKDQYETKDLESRELARKYNDEQGKVASLEQKLRELEGKVAEANQKVLDTEGQLMNKEAERRSLEQRIAELSALNEELSVSKKKLAEAKEALEKRSSEYESLAQSLKGEIQSGKIELSELKGRMTVKMKDKILFASGSTKVGKEGEDALTKVAKAFKGLRGKVVRVEGHTDDVPTDPNGPYPSNWELSLARAMAVVRHLQAQGVDPTLLSAAGYGQFQPIAANDSAEHRSLNRRIEIVLAPSLDNVPTVPTKRAAK